MSEPTINSLVYVKTFPGQSSSKGPSSPIFVKGTIKNVRGPQLFGSQQSNPLFLVESSKSKGSKGSKGASKSKKEFRTLWVHRYDMFNCNITTHLSLFNDHQHANLNFLMVHGIGRPSSRKWVRISSLIIYNFGFCSCFWNIYKHLPTFCYLSRSPPYYESPQKSVGLSLSQLPWRLWTCSLQTLTSFLLASRSSSLASHSDWFRSVPLYLHHDMSTFDMILYTLFLVYSLEAPPATVQFRYTLYRLPYRYTSLAYPTFLLGRHYTLRHLYPVTLVYTHHIDSQHLVHLPFPFCISQ